MTESEAAVAVALSRRVGPAVAAQLLKEHGSYLEVVRASFRQEVLLGAAPVDVAKAVRESVRSREYARDLELAAEAGARFAVPGDGDYPDPLAEIASPPVGIYVIGDALAALTPMVGIVGTRTPTPRGAAVATELAADLARAGLTVVSGMARGVDGRAHDGAIEAGGRTVAVMGCGLSHTYPPENAALRRRIADSGALVSEFPMRAEPLPGRFPRRNRIIAGLSAGVVVVEAAARSGALITAARALEQGREVFAVPGPVDAPLSVGPNRLIKAGAKLVEDAGDVLDELESSWGPFPVGRPGGRGVRELDPESGGASGETVGEASDEAPEVGLPALLSKELSLTPVTVDELVCRTGAPIHRVLSAIARLELSGEAERTPAGGYVRGARRAGRGSTRGRGR